MIKISLALVAALSLAGAGCKKGGGGGDSDCAASIGKGVDNMSATARGKKDPTPDEKAKMDEFLGKMKAVIITRCTEDKWPADVTKCMETITGRPDMMKCQGMLPQDQQDKVRGQVRDLMMTEGMGRMHMRGHDGSGGPGPADGSGAAGTLPAGSGNAPAAPAAPGSAAPAAGSAQ